MTYLPRTLSCLAMLASLSAVACDGDAPPTETVETALPELNPTQWRVHTHDYKTEAFDTVYDQARGTVSPAHDLALIAPAAAPQPIDSAALAVARNTGKLGGIDVRELIVVEARGEGFVVLVRGGRGFVAKRLIVPASAEKEVGGMSLVTFSARHVEGSQSSAMGDATGVVALASWLDGGAS